MNLVSVSSFCGLQPRVSGYEIEDGDPPTEHEHLYYQISIRFVVYTKVIVLTICAAGFEMKRFCNIYISFVCVDVIVLSNNASRSGWTEAKSQILRGE